MRRTFYTTSYSHHSSFLIPTGVTKFEGKPHHRWRKIQRVGKSCIFNYYRRLSRKRYEIGPYVCYYQEVLMYLIDPSHYRRPWVTLKGVMREAHFWRISGFSARKRSYCFTTSDQIQHVCGYGVFQVGMCGLDFLISVRFRFSSWKKLGFGSEWIWFGSVCKNSVRFG